MVNPSNSQATNANNATKTTKAPTNLNYDGRPLNANEVLVPMHMDELFIKSNVTNPDSIITLTIGEHFFKAVLVAVDKAYEADARAQFNYWQNEVLGHYGHRMTDVSIEDRQDRDLPELGSSPSAADIADEMFTLLDLMEVLIKKAPQAAYAGLLKMYGVDRAEFESKMRLEHNGANKAYNKAYDIITDLLTNDIDEDRVKANKTKNDDYYREEATALLELIIKLRY